MIAVVILGFFIYAYDGDCADNTYHFQFIAMKDSDDDDNGGPNRLRIGFMRCSWDLVCL